MEIELERELIWDDAMRHLVRIAAAVAGAAPGVVRRTMADAVGGADGSAVEEVLLQSYLFAGFPRTLNAMTAWRDVSGAPAPATDPEAGIERVDRWTAQGEAACRTVYGPVYDTLRANVRALHPALDAWMLVDGYGKVLSRPALSLARRELCIVAACAASEQAPQLRSHLHGALNCGATPDDLTHTLSALTDVITRDAMTTARDALKDVIARANAREIARENTRETERERTGAATTDTTELKELGA